MRYAICLEEMEGRWIAHVPALPGCFVSADNRIGAEAGAPQAIRDYLDWRRARGDDSIALDLPVEVEVDEIVREWPNPIDPEYVVNAFFAADAPPFTPSEIAVLPRLLECSRADLLSAIDGLSDDDLRRPLEGEWSIGGILNHAGRAEWWYLDRLGLAPLRDQEPATGQARLQVARARLHEVLPALEGLARIEMKSGELWSPRKLIRRVLWHERDHTQHILQFRERLKPA